MVNDVQSWFMANGPLSRSCPQAQVRVLVVEEKVRIESAELLEALAADQHAATGHPTDIRRPICRQNPALSLRTRAEQRE
jgi:hypothetical protein